MSSLFNIILVEEGSFLNNCCSASNHWGICHLGLEEEEEDGEEEGEEEGEGALLLEEEVEVEEEEEELEEEELEGEEGAATVGSRVERVLGFSFSSGKRSSGR